MQLGLEALAGEDLFTEDGVNWRIFEKATNNAGDAIAGVFDALKEAQSAFEKAKAALEEYQEKCEELQKQCETTQPANPVPAQPRQPTNQPAAQPQTPKIKPGWTRPKGGFFGTGGRVEFDDGTTLHYTTGIFGGAVAVDRNGRQIPADWYLNDFRSKHPEAFR